MSSELPGQSYPDDPTRRDALTAGMAAADTGLGALDDHDTFRAACEFVEAGVRYGRALRERGTSREMVAGMLGGAFATMLLEALGDE